MNLQLLHFYPISASNSFKKDILLESKTLLKQMQTQFETIYLNRVVKYQNTAILKFKCGATVTSFDWHAQNGLCNLRTIASLKTGNITALSLGLENSLLHLYLSTSPRSCAITLFLLQLWIQDYCILSLLIIYSKLFIQNLMMHCV